MLRRLAFILVVAAAFSAIALRGVSTPRRTIALGSFGHGPTVVLVHGLGSSPEHWLPMARDLARDHHVVLVDLPGHGLAELPQPFTLIEATRMLDYTLRDLGDEPVVLVGHSVGGLICAEEALRSPRRVRALVLVETALRPQLSAAARAQLEEALKTDFAGTLRGTYESFGRDSAQGARLAAEVAQLDPSMLKSWIHLAVTTDLSRDVVQLQMPVMAVVAPHTWGDHESWRACADSLGYTKVPSLIVQRVDDSGHFVMLDHPRTLANAVRRFARASAPAMVASQ